MIDTDVHNPIRILLVEDSPHDRQVFHRAFRKSNILTQITDCNRAEAALELLAADATQYDLVVSDQGLPGSSGLDLYRQLQCKQVQLPFVLLTGVGNELLAVEALKLGVDDYLPKNAGQLYCEQLPATIARAYQVHHDRVQKAQIEAELEARDAREQFLSEATATALLADMDDYETTTAEVARLPVPFFADGCLVDLLNQNAMPRHVAAAHVDPDQQRLIDELTAVLAVTHNSGPVAAEAMQRRQTKLIAQVLDSRELFGASTADIAEIVAALNLQSAICIPLLVRYRVIGVMWLFYSNSGRGYHDSDISFAELLGQRAAIAIENARVYAAARDADRRKDEFLATLAHELRNPLAPIRNALEILRVGKADLSLVEKAMTTMERQVDHLVRLVDDLLDLSRVMRGKITLRKQRVALDAIIERALETTLPVIEAREHELIVNLPPHEVWLDVDEVRIAQILANLLNNAAKYTDEGGHIWLQCDVEDGELLARVRDDGIGMESKAKSHIFDLFQQVESSLDWSHGGLGIGLTLVRSLTELHDGSVSAHSDGLGKGSAFIVRLPILDQKGQGENKVATAKRCDAASGELSILVVDDNVDAAEMLSELLRLDGHEVTSAHEGQSALEQAAAVRPDVIFLDIGLPGMSGYEVAQQLRKQEEFSGTLIIAVTGFGQEIDRQCTQNAGFDHHLVKPVQPQRIRELLAAASSGDSRTQLGPASLSADRPRLG
jgi:signal transduction histidine kinase/DNA-binding response OmpR family regulator